jgi:hypothetical protein
MNIALPCGCCIVIALPCGCCIVIALPCGCCSVIACSVSIVGGVGVVFSFAYAIKFTIDAISGIGTVASMSSSRRMKRGEDFVSINFV